MKPTVQSWDGALWDIPAVTPLPRQIAAMHKAHGTGLDGRKCGDCTHLVKMSGDHQIKPFKCQKSRISNGAASDWRLKWPACGLFTQRETE